MNTQQMQQGAYVAPAIEMIEIAIEKGFSASTAAMEAAPGGSFDTIDDNHTY